MKKLVSYFIKYPVATYVIIIAFLIFGSLSAFNLKSSFFPIVESRIISIQLIYPGASPQEVEEGITLKIEEKLKGVQGIERITSTSSENSANIIVVALKNYKPNLVLQDVKNAVDQINSFPVGMEPPVIFKRENRSFTLSLALSGENVDLKTLKYVARQLETDFLDHEGVSLVSLSGFPDEEIEVAVRENDLRTYNLSFEQVALAVRSSNLDITGGKIKTDTEELLIRARNKYYSAEDLENLIIRSDAKGRTILLRDVANVRNRWSENPNSIKLNSNPSVEVRVENTDSEDLLATADFLREYIDAFNARNKTIKATIIRDGSVTLNERRDLLFNNGMLGALLVVTLLSLFLNPRLAFWVAFGIPVSFLGMFILASFYGVTINVISLFGMIVVIGILVDDGIVIAENIYHHYELGKTPVRAAIDGTIEVLPAVISAVLTTIIAFSAFFFIDGRMGDFFSELSFVVIATLAVSLIEALILLPSHISHSRGMQGEKKQNVIVRTMDKAMFWMRDKTYAPVLKFFLNHRAMALAIPVALLLITIGAFKGGIIKGTFFPFIERDNIDITLKMPAGTRSEVTDYWISQIEEAAWKANQEMKSERGDSLDVIKNIVKQLGPTTADAKISVNLIKGEIREMPSFEIANRIRKFAPIIVDAERLAYGGNSTFGMPVSVSFLGNNLHELELAKEDLKTELRKMSDLKDVNDNNQEGNKEIILKLNPQAHQLGLNLQLVMAQVRQGFFGFEVQRLQRGADEVRVWVRYDEENRSSLGHLEDMWIRTPSGAKVPLSEIASYEIKRSVVAINHLDAKREIKVEADIISPDISVTDIMAEVEADIVPLILAKYPSVIARFEGQNREASKTSNSATKVLPVMLFLIMAVITFTFRSIGQTIIIIMIIPFSFIGIAWGHWFHGFPVNVLSFLGIIALVGIIVNDSLVLVSKLNIFLKSGMKFEEAIFKAGFSRFRAIFLTSLTTIAGLGPLIAERSFQAQFLIPMAISIAYGIAVATVLTLIVLPVVLSLYNDAKVYLYWGYTGEKPKKEEVERSVKELKAEQDEHFI
ncbi:MAG: efflux RND transporter permease subunit [Bacteroidales bacterium]|nr:efflux RND transporter permease subunit [Bacteroidales bacterium]